MAGAAKMRQGTFTKGGQILCAECGGGGGGGPPAAGVVACDRCGEPSAIASGDVAALARMRDDLNRALPSGYEATLEEGPALRVWATRRYQAPCLRVTWDGTGYLLARFQEWEEDRPAAMEHVSGPQDPALLEALGWMFGGAALCS